jgi:hypothetical protein
MISFASRSCAEPRADGAEARREEDNNVMGHSPASARISNNSCSGRPCCSVSFAATPCHRASYAPSRKLLPEFSLTFFISVLFLFPIAASAATLQSVYDAADPQAGYTKYLQLDAGATYTGGLTVLASDMVCIKGNGATLDLQTSTIQIQGKGARLDVDHCVIKNGGLASAGYAEGALSFVGSSGSVVNNTLYGNTVGIRVYSTGPGAVTVINNVVVRSSFTGLLCQIGNEPNVSYNDSWANGTYNYSIDCG